MSELGYPRFEHLSASAFQAGPIPNLDDAIRLGRSERVAIFEAAKAEASVFYLEQLNNIKEITIRVKLNFFIGYQI